MNVQTESRILPSLYLLRTLTYGPENQKGLSVVLWLYTGKVWSRSNEKRQRNQLLRIFLFCLLVALTLTVRSWKSIGLLYFLSAIHQPSFQRDRSRNNGYIEAESKCERKKENNKNKKLYKNRKVYRRNRLRRSTLNIGTNVAPTFTRTCRLFSIVVTSS